MQDCDYVLGHSAEEHERLDLQGALYRDITRNALIDAGVADGLSVLDIGCGSGDVTRLVADLVGQAGSVLGIDRDVGTIDAARARTRLEGTANASFSVHEIGVPLPEQPFDALVGRFILMHQEKPSDVLRDAAAAVSSGGIVVLVESNMESLFNGQHSMPHLPLYEKIVRWKCRVVKAAGADLRAGLRLRETFVQAGLPEPALRMSAPIEGGTDSPIYGYMADSCRSMLPRAEKFGVGGMNEEYVDTLEGRLRDDVVDGCGVVVGWPVVAAWCTIP